jgi:predicted phosphodiesterase
MGNGMIGSRANQLQKQAHVVNADVYVSGHTHSQLVSSDNVFVREGERMIRKRRLYVSSGSFCNYENYASERGYVPGRLGAPRIFFDGTHKDCHVSI